MPEYTVRIDKAKNLKPRPSDDDLVFGTVFTDHMFVMDWEAGKGWHDPRIVPYGPFPIEPAMVTLHYAQSVFEGMKAFRQKDGGIALFRPQENLKRLNYSSARMCIPPIDEAFVLESLKELVALDGDWVPHKEGTSLYIRPFIFASEPFLGVRPAKSYRLMIILSPVGAYYASGFAPIKIRVEDEFVRAVRGGTGHTKAAGNYASSLLAAEKAKADGFTQVLWLDAVERKWIEEVGTMNIAFVIDDEVVTPPLTGSILGGITRDSMLILVRSWGLKASERPVDIAEVFAAAQKNQLSEVFGTGTACVISAVGEMQYKGRVWKSENGQVGPLSQRLFDEITGIQYGSKPDPFGWVVPVP